MEAGEGVLREIPGVCPLQHTRWDPLHTRHATVAALDAPVQAGQRVLRELSLAGLQERPRWQSLHVGDRPPAPRPPGPAAAEQGVLTLQLRDR